MKKVFTIFGLIYLSLNVFSQNEESKAAAKIIQYANNVIELTNGYFNDLQTHEKKLKQLMSQKSIAQKTMDFKIEYSCAEKSYDTNAFKMATEQQSFFTEIDNVSFLNDLEWYKNGMEFLSTQCSKIERQIALNLFKVDDSNALDSLIISSNHKIEELLNYHKNIAERLNKNTEVAEQKLNENHPMGELIKPIKADLKLAKKILEITTENCEESKRMELKMLNLRLKSDISQHKALAKILKRKFSKPQLANFQEFYAAIESNFVPLIETVLSSLSTKKDAPEKPSNEVLQNAYNELVELFNSLGEI